MSALRERHRIARQLRTMEPDRPAGRKTDRKRRKSVPKAKPPVLLGAPPLIPDEKQKR